MNVNERIFSSKLRELARQYERMQREIRTCQAADYPQVRREIDRARSEFRESEAQLEDNVRGCRSDAVAALAEAQLEYCRKCESILNRQMDAGVGGAPREERAEAAALYAEYAMDFATQAARYALLSALSAMDLQMKCEEEREEKHE